MIDFSGEKFKSCSTLIKMQYNKNLSWDQILNIDFVPFGKTKEEKLKQIEYIVGDTSTSEWDEFVNQIKFDLEYGTPAIIVPTGRVTKKQLHSFKPRNDEFGSAWYHYHEKLLKSGIAPDDVEHIQDSANWILNNLSLDTTNEGPIKGLVVGNVQSGKTANMGALMAMAADEGWNFFIILSGVIENLRMQTQERFINDLTHSKTNVVWHGLDNYDIQQKNKFNLLANLDLSPNSNSRYLVVTLKNSNRLESLLKYLSSDLKNRQNLKILLIDDEADQASINTGTKKILNDENEIIDIERTKINNSIVQLINNYNQNKKLVSTKFKAINYIAYTATPYANVLNEEPGKNSLYPEDFVASLENSKSYFGPQTIFGLEGTDNDGMNIINYVSEDDSKFFDKIYSGETKEIPKSLKDSILWFYCCYANRRHMEEGGKHKTYSMLIHTSSRQIHHAKVAKAIQCWFSRLDEHDFLHECEKVYKTQVNMFSLNDFYKTCSEYPKTKIVNKKEVDIPVMDYLPFKDIIADLINIYKNGMHSINIDEEGEYQFREGVHLCIDNSDNNKITNDNEHIRLVYPKSELSFTSGFIVIGGTTLSRGLTIKGLLSTYFIRNVLQADTLMQMGRWFGYRKGYELLPRIWLEEETREKFDFLSSLDYELRSDIKYMEENEVSPREVGIRVKYCPKKKYLDISSKNKIKAAETTNLDFSGINTQTTKFYADETILKSNYDNTNDFISLLGEDSPLPSGSKAQNCYLWKNVPDDTVLDYIQSMKYPHKGGFFVKIEVLKKWYQEVAAKNGFENWNVVLAGVDNAKEENTILIGGKKATKVNRSKKIDSGDEFIRIGALRSEKDLFVDIDINDPGLLEEDKIAILKSESENFKMIRKRSIEKNKSLLIIYVIDKNSMPRKNEPNRAPLGTENEVIGLTIVIPPGDVHSDGPYLKINISELNDD